MAKDYLTIDREETNKDLMRDILDEEGTIKIGGLEFNPSRIIEELDPIAFRTMINDAEFSENYFECEECGTEWDEEEENAKNCCTEE